jgi:hypothetical protein
MMSTLPPVTLERARFRGWHAVHLDNGIIHLAVVPDIGGRIMALDLDGYEFLYVNPRLAGKLFTPTEHAGDGTPSAWKNFGGDRTWPAPQGWDNDELWHGPPDPILDSGRYSLAVLQAREDVACIEMTSKPDPHTGIKISRRLTMGRGASRIKLDLSFTNTSDRPRRWSIWDGTQLRAERLQENGDFAPETECVITAPLNPHSRFPKGYQVMSANPDNPQWTTDTRRGLLVARYLFEMGKIGWDSPGGWIAFHNGAVKTSFLVNFTHFSAEEYPDRGVNLECWTSGRGEIPGITGEDDNSGIYLMETEVLSPLLTFQPGERRSFRLEWGVCRTDGMVVQANPAGAISQPLTAEPAPGGLRLTGQFGVFDQGILEIVWRDRAQHALQVQSLELVTPFRALLLEQLLSPPAGAASVLLQVAADADRSARKLAEVAI